MKRYLMAMAATVLILPSCGKDHSLDPFDKTNFAFGAGLSHEEIVLGDKLENPYTVQNVSAALSAVYPTKARVEVETTNLYVRFLPKDDAELELLSDLKLTDHPLDYDIKVEGDWYHDPTVEKSNVTWMYAVVDKDYKFPKVEYEIIDKCFLSENRTVTRGDEGIDWDEVIRESYRLTGNEDMLGPETKTDPAYPSGRITVVDKDYDGGKPHGVAGVEVCCNSFVKFSTTYTDENGYYKLDKKFNTSVRYRLIFQNKKGFAQGFNAILVPASVSTLGKADPSGVNVTITENNDDKLFRRCVVNNAASDYYENISSYGVSLPPRDLRIWIFPDLAAGSATMLHHGTIISTDKMAEWVKLAGNVITYFAPDITIGVKGRNSYKEIYGEVVHELAHASHYAQVGKQYWNKYILHIISSWILTGGETYGEGTETYAGYCEIGEMWAYHIENQLMYDRYKGAWPTNGYSYWFHPQYFHYMAERGISTATFFKALGIETHSLDALHSKLVSDNPSKKSIIDQVFGRYDL